MLDIAERRRRVAIWTDLNDGQSVAATAGCYETSMADVRRYARQVQGWIAAAALGMRKGEPDAMSELIYTEATLKAVAALVDDTVLPPPLSSSCHAVWSTDATGLVHGMVEGGRLIPIRMLKTCVPAQQPNKETTMFGKNVTIRHKNVDGIVATVYVTCESEAAPDNGWWLASAVQMLRRAVASGLGHCAHSNDDWVLVKVGQ